MSHYRTKPVVVTALTFEELVAYGLNAEGANIRDGLPWHFNFVTRSRDGVETTYVITNENTNCYLVPVRNSGGIGYRPFNRGDMLVVDVNGELVHYTRDQFDKAFDYESE